MRTMTDVTMEPKSSLRSSCLAFIVKLAGGPFRLACVIDSF